MARHILVIDHDPLIQRTLRALARWQIPFEWARTVAEGAAFLKDERPAAVVHRIDFARYGWQRSLSVFEKPSQLPRVTHLPHVATG